MDIRSEKKQLFNYLISSHVPEAAYEDVVKNMGIMVEEKFIRRWKKQFYSQEKDFEFPTNPRLINRFMLGADPEFLLADINRADSRSHYVFAENLGLTTLGCFGSDMSGRQAEIRAYPSRFALDVVASMLEAMRWMAFTNKGVRERFWQSVAYINSQGRNDGFGGHVHFGRRRFKELNQDLVNLDRLTASLLSVGVLDNEGQLLRQANTNYGRNGDYREQQHGFEYRSMPTWMHSPQAAHFVLTVSKLTVINKTFAVDLLRADNVNKRQAILNAFKNYRYEDDDVRIATRAIELNGWPLFQLHYDFKEIWGISSEIGETSPIYFPTIIPGHEMTRRQIFDQLVYGLKIPVMPPQVTWEPSVLPEGLSLMQVKPHVFGVPEIAQGLICNKWCVNIIGNRANGIQISTHPTQWYPAQEVIDKELGQLKYNNILKCTHLVDNNLSKEIVHIYVPIGVHDDYGNDKELIEQVKQFLCSGLFPIAKAKNYRELLKFEFKEHGVSKKKEKLKMGKIILNTRMVK
jgi:hypothetical protein